MREESSGAARRGIWTRLAWVLLVAGAIAVAGVIFLPDRTPPVAAEDLRRAMAAWSRQACSEYSLTLLKESDLREPERIVTRVKDGKVVDLLLDGAPLPASDAYTVDGIFATIEREIEMAAAGGAAEGTPRGAVLKGAFHPELGVPIIFKRLASGRQSFILTVEELSVPAGVLYSREGR
jgi:hypothetical protein